MELQTITDAAIDIVARAIYENMPETDSGEYVDGFCVSPGGELSWSQMLESGDHAVAPYRKAARAAIIVMRELTD